MKLGIMSDSHDHLGNISKAAEAFSRRKIAALIHGGDMCSPFVFRRLEQLREFCPRMYAVFGNNDGDRLTISKAAERFSNVTVHGHMGTIEVAGEHAIIVDR